MPLDLAAASETKAMVFARPVAEDRALSVMPQFQHVLALEALVTSTPHSSVPTTKAVIPAICTALMKTRSEITPSQEVYFEAQSANCSCISYNMVMLGAGALSPSENKQLRKQVSYSQRVHSFVLNGC